MFSEGGHAAAASFVLTSILVLSLCLYVVSGAALHLGSALYTTGDCGVFYLGSCFVIDLFYDHMI